MIHVLIDYMVDGTMQRDEVNAERAGASIVSDSGVCYLHTPDEDRLYRRAERVVITRTPLRPE